MKCPQCNWAMSHNGRGVHICDNVGCTVDRGDGNLIKPCVVEMKVHNPERYAEMMRSP